MINTTEIDANPSLGPITYTPRTNMEEVMHFISSHSTYIILVILAITIYFIYKIYGARVKRYITDMTAKQKRIFIVMQVIAGLIVIVMDYQLGSRFDIFGDMFLQNAISWAHFGEQALRWDALSHLHFRLDRIDGEEALIAWAITLLPVTFVYVYNFIQKD